MSCFNENQTIRSEYVKDSGGHRRMFFRKSGTAVEQGHGDRYVAGESSLIIQWDGSPTHDSGYHARHFPPTKAGLKQAHAEMDGLGS